MSPYKSSEERAYGKASRAPRRVERCSICGDPIVGKKWRISDDPPKFADTKCYNQRPR